MSSTDTLITYEQRGDVAVVGLNRPDRRNAINEEVVQALRTAVLRAHDQARTAVIHGHGNNFSSGLDLKECLDRLSNPPTGDFKRRRHSWHEVFDLIARGPIPWVAALHGATIGGGLELALATHLRVGDETAFFGLPEGQRGIFVGGGGTVRVQRVIGFTVMADLMLTGRLLDAEEGERHQIIRYRVAEGQALNKAIELAQRIARNTLDTNWRIINVLPRVADASHDDGLFIEQLTSAMYRPPEAASRLRDFLDGRSERLRAPGEQAHG